MRALPGGVGVYPEMLGRMSLKNKLHMGLRGKLFIMVGAVVMIIAAALTYYSSEYLSQTINQEYCQRAEAFAGFFDAAMANMGGMPMDKSMQGHIDSLMRQNEDVEKINIYAPVGGSVRDVASSDRSQVGKLAAEADAAPLSGGGTRFMSKCDEDKKTTAATAGANPAGSGGDRGTVAPLPRNAIEMISPLRDTKGNVIASIGVYLNTAERDNLIRSEQIRFGLITNLGLLALLGLFYFAFNRFMLRPMRQLTEKTKQISGRQYDPVPGIDRHDEIGELALAVNDLSLSLKWRDEEVGLLLAASASVSSSLSVDKILQTLCNKIASSRKVTFCRVSLLEPETGMMVIKAVAAARPVEWDYRVGDKFRLEDAHYHSQVLNCGSLVLIKKDGLSTADRGREWDWVLTPDTQSALLLPLWAGDDIIGVVTLGEVRSWKRATFSSNKTEFYRTLVNHAATAIDNARLYEKAGRQVRELSAMHNISQALTSTLNYQEVINAVAQKVGSLFGAQFASVLIPDEKRRNLKIVASFNLSREYIWAINKKRRMPMGAGPVGKAFMERKPFVVENVFSDRSYEQWKHIASMQGYASLIALPLVAKNESIGVICIYFAEPRKFDQAEIDLLATSANESAIAIENARMYLDLQEALVGTIRSLAETIDAKDPYTRGHSERVSLYAEAIGRGLGLGSEELRTVRYAGYLHDVGKIGIPDAILSKTGKLSLEEFNIIKKHPVRSERILEPVSFPFPVQPIVRHHHERFDGKGYPDGLAGEEIPLGARILLVADAYEAMTSDRPYRKAHTAERALKELMANKGTQFDPRVADVFAKVIMAGSSYQRQMKMGA